MDPRQGGATRRGSVAVRTAETKGQLDRSAVAAIITAAAAETATPVTAEVTAAAPAAMSAAAVTAAMATAAVTAAVPTTARPLSCVGEGRKHDNATGQGKGDRAHNEHSFQHLLFHEFDSKR